jgi:hypothetical protein
MPMPFNSNMSPAGAQLGLGGIPGLGTALADQVGTDTEEMRRKRMLEAQQRQLLGPGGSPAAGALFGSALGGLGG